MFILNNFFKERGKSVMDTIEEKCAGCLYDALKKLKKLRGFSPPANYTDQATAACRRS
jgi:hypothetical protein